MFSMGIVPLTIGILLRSAVMLQPYSGEGKPPMFGDFEAQRHWMEITVSLPLHSWYFNSSDNDLNYWGLDYPPVSAYHSWLMGQAARWINSSWVVLHDSRGLESDQLKAFMRYTVLISEFLTFIPAVVLYSYFGISKLKTTCLHPEAICLFMMTYPGLILVDHGHFQYNCVSLGLFLYALSAFLLNYDVIGTFIFTFSIFYKQMELYHALPFFFYTLSRCLRAPCFTALRRLVCLGITVLTALAIIFAPFMSMPQLGQIFVRMFPVHRGLFEDKVSNFWCVSSVLLKWSRLLTKSQLLSSCTLLTLITSLPACVSLILAPERRRLLYAQAVTSLSFFLFSYHVHEKSILLSAIPALCLLPISPGSSFYFCCLSTLSMWPLLAREHLALACLCLMTIYLFLGYIWIPTKLSSGVHLQSGGMGFVFSCSMAIYLLLFSLMACISPHKRYPDIFPLLISALSFLHFILFLFIWIRKLF